MIEILNRVTTSGLEPCVIKQIRDNKRIIFISLKNIQGYETDTPFAIDGKMKQTIKIYISNNVISIYDTEKDILTATQCIDNFMKLT